MRAPGEVDAGSSETRSRGLPDAPRRDRDAVRAALGAAYRHIDTAAAYNNERQVGEAVHSSDLDRSEVYDIGTLRDFGRIKAEFISGEQPASTAVQVGALALPAMMIELEAIAVV